ncbi:MAG: Translation initiation factor IF-1 [Firmicutes bacterium ADurb.Bin080]|jgi:translation initiation factor IF-1|nr:translation initiation factor IF-1 [Clostridiales bacterium]OQC15614.1 MAG: Translation initiation factor IF-1 [Firmicutes bacterium ADurb.Bin080]
MPKETQIEEEGTVIEVLPGTKFKVELKSGRVVLAYLAGKMRQHFVKVCQGDSVRVAFSQYDFTQGRIIYRNKN